MDDKQQYLMQLQILEQEANRFGEQLKIINEQKLRLIAEGFRKSSFSPQLNDSREKKLLACNA